MNTQHDRMPAGVIALAISAFAIGSSEFIVVGILPSIAADLRISLDSAGALVSLYALALALGTPLLVLALSRLARTRVLAGLLVAFLLGNLASAFSTSYAMLLAGRVVTAVAHGAFFAIGATVAAALVASQQAGRAIATMFAGLTLAMVIGVPLGSFLGNLMEWRLPFLAVALLAAIGLGAMLRWLPGQLPQGGAGKASAQLAALASPAILSMMAVTVLGFGASFAAFTFITPILTDISGFSAATASALLVVFGAATFVGNLVGGRLVTRYGWACTLAGMLVGLALAQALIALVIRSQTPIVAMLFVWGLFAFGLGPPLQAAMLATAQRYTPQAMDFASSLNISAFNLGISMGALCGSLIVARGAMELTPWAGSVAALAALLPLAALAVLHARPTTDAVQPAITR
ncbi:MFS transporter [Massilia sp. CFBP9012]|uniref:MFS transporter n=1 Tax=Massilia sp. CFBP9012 TaxID=3096531 RepID=UPI002A69DDD1|nr:MFS transporter [Massilia sp. CFBP9012]MDY0973805.1 MFS transporter [Massilia sp. CFBP9012]